MFKVGDLITLDRIAYPQYSGYFGTIIKAGPWCRDQPPSWVKGNVRPPYQVLINGRLHPYAIYERDMTNETEDEA